MSITGHDIIAANNAFGVIVARGYFNIVGGACVWLYPPTGFTAPVPIYNGVGDFTMQLAAPLPLQPYSICINQARRTLVSQQGAVVAGAFNVQNYIQNVADNDYANSDVGAIMVLVYNIP